MDQINIKDIYYYYRRVWNWYGEEVILLLALRALVTTHMIVILITIASVTTMYLFSGEPNNDKTFLQMSTKTFISNNLSLLRMDCSVGGYSKKLYYFKRVAYLYGATCCSSDLYKKPLHKKDNFKFPNCIYTLIQLYKATTCILRPRNFGQL